MKQVGEAVQKDTDYGSYRINFLLPLIYLLLTVGIGLIIHLDQRGAFPKVGSFIYCDAGWYKEIRDNGYVYVPGKPNNTAFFPFFPYLWRSLGLGILGISIFNGVLFALGCGLLLSVLKAEWRVKLLYLGLSLLVFYVTPFSESLFYGFGVLLIYGLRKELPYLVVIAVIGCGLTRSMGTILTPAFIIIGCMQWLKSKRFRVALPYLGYASLSILVMLSVFSIQWYETGEFFAFAKTQKSWSTEWRMPNIPFSTWGSEDNWLYDQLALFVCLLCIVWVIAYIARVAGGKIKTTEDTALLLSVLYCCGVALLMLFTKGGRFNSINRYVFATPFIVVLLTEVAKARVKHIHYLSIALLGITYFLICWNMGATMERTLNAAGVTLFCFMLPRLLQSRNSWLTILTCVLSAGLLYAQGQFWFRYMVEEWVG